MKELSRILALMSVLGGLAWAGEYGKIAGRITDSETGDPLAGASVKITETGQGTAADENGYFVILRVSPGTYTITAQMVGYGAMTYKNVKVDADRTVELNFKLEPGAVTMKVIEVIAKEPIIKKDVTASVTNIRAEKIAAMPVSNVEQAILLQTGVKQYGAYLQVRGGRPGEVAFVVDGAEIRNPYTGYQATQLPLDAIQETSVSKGGFGAEYGSAASGVISVSTKEAGNKPEFNFTARTSALPGDIFNSNEGDPYMKWFSKDYMRSDGPYSYDSLFAYENARWKAYDSMGIKNTEIPAFYYNQYWKDGEYTLPIEHRENMTRYQFSVGTPIPFTKNKIKVFTSWDWTWDGTRFPGNSNKQLSDQTKVTFTPTNSLKLFFSTVGSQQLQGAYDPGWRIALSHLSVSSNKSRQYVGGINYLFSPKTYLELRGSYYKLNTHMDAYEDMNMDGIDDFGDRDNDGYPEVDPGALALIGKYIDPSWIREWSPDSEWVELNMYWWESQMTGLHPSLAIGRYNSDYIVCVVTGGDPAYADWIGDTMTFDVSDPVLDSITVDTLQRIGNIYTPNRSTWDRQVYFNANYTTWNFRSDLVSQDFANMKGHEMKMGFEFVRHHVDRHSMDYASGGNIYTDEVNAKPYKMALYARDKMEFQGMIANVGFRFDYFNPNAWLPKDPWHPVKSTQTISATDSVWVNKPEVRDTYLLLAPERAPSHWYISPRVGISHPITERDVLHFTYGHYFQEPMLRYLYMNQYYMWNGAFPLMGNPGLKPEKTISYEVGVKHAFTGEMVVDFTAFYKDISDLVQTRRYDLETGRNYTTFINQDFASIRGFEIQFSKLPGGFLPYFSYDLNYTFQLARGSFSSAFSSYSYSWARLPLSYSEEHYLNWDERHTLSMIFTWAVPLEANMLTSGYGVSAIYTYGSGTPWSPPIRDIRDALELMNTLRMTPHSNWDMRLYKDFGFKNLDARIFTDIYNIWNQHYISGYNDSQYFYYFGDPEGEVRDPTVYNARRVTRVGIQFFWKP